MGSQPDVSVVQLTTRKFSPAELPRMSFEIFRYLKNHKTDICVAADYRCAVALGLVPFSGKKVAILHGTDARGRLYELLDKLRLYRPLEWYSKVIANSEFTKSLALGHHPYLKRRGVIASRLGIDFETFAAVSDTDPNVIRKQIGIPEGNLVVLSVGRLEPRKGYEFAVDAVGLLPPKERGRITYLLVGKPVDEKYTTKLELKISTVGSDVRLLGAVDAKLLQEIYSVSDIFIHPSVPEPRAVEGFGLVLLEAGAKQIPVVSTFTDAIPEVVEDGITGLLVPPRDKVALSQAVAMLANDPVLRKKLGNQAKFHAASFTWEKHVAPIVAD